MTLRMLDLCCGLGGWTEGFQAEGYECDGIDILPQPKYPGRFIQRDLLTLSELDLIEYDFICASTPCNQFSVHCMEHFHKNPPFPELGLRLFNHARNICDKSGKPYIMENVHCAEKFVGHAVNHCGPFYLWGNSVPAIMPKELFKVQKGMHIGNGQQMRTMTREEIRAYRKQFDILNASSRSSKRSEMSSHFAKIPIEISRYIAQCSK